MRASNVRTLSIVGCLAVALILLVSLVIKASTTSFTHDESVSFLRYVPTSFMDIISYKRAFTNNHILNSLGMKYAEMAFGSSPLSLRSPNLMAFILYMLFAWGLLRRSLGAIGSFTLFCALTLHPYLWEFFGLARGYGLSIAAMMGSLYCAVQHTTTGRMSFRWAFYILGLLAVLANFTAILFLLSAAGILGLILWRIQDQEGSERRIFTHAEWVMPLVSVAILYEPFRRSMSPQNTDFGGSEGFFHDTILSSVDRYFYNSPPFDGAYMIGGITIVAIAVISMGWAVQKVTRSDLSDPGTITGVITNLTLLLVVVGSLILHYVFGHGLLAERYALFLFPLLVLGAGIAFSSMSSTIDLRWRVPITASILLLMIGSFGQRIQMNSYLNWQYDASTHDAVQWLIMEQGIASKDDGSVILSTPWIYEPTFNFYRLTWGLDQLQPVDRSGYKATATYYYENMDRPEFGEDGSLKQIATFGPARTHLLARQ